MTGTVVHTSAPVVGDIAGRLAALRDRRALHADRELCDEVRDLVVVCSSSRAGSSLLGELLRSSPQLITTSAEINPHLVVPVLGRGPDLLADPAPALAAGPGRVIAREELSLDLGRAPTGAEELAPATFTDHAAWRLTMQWPNEPIDPDHVADVTGPPPRGRPRASWFVRWLSRLRERHPGISPERYDLTAQPRAGRMAERRRERPPFEPVVEMAPYVAPRPWVPATREDVRARPVVLVTPRNAFRLPLLAELFPNARLRVVHLVRNPAGSVNGLRDGWLHPDFVTCEVPGGLDIAGYSDLYPSRGDLWCFDLPPDWREVTVARLEEVCAHQWRAAHEATIAATTSLGIKRHVLRFEDVVGSRHRRRRALSGLAGMLGVDPGPLLGDDLPVVMATRPPRPARWRENADVLGDVLRDDRTLEVAARLGYGRDPSTWS